MSIPVVVRKVGDMSKLSELIAISAESFKKSLGEVAPPATQRYTIHLPVKTAIKEPGN